ncbi:nitrous oxide reductase accessory protein NosL [Balneola sp. MJW-20]|uniref:nitrous oxide reductase accessory protein NosL n=1 Tax=Gracilimonas aurantiaca TaxID=3234185 RepID=UPI0034652B22
MKRSKVVIMMISCLILSCEPAPETISFGKDSCAYCSMGIADPSFAAELVTGKGKVYKYDSIECMVRGHREMDETVSLVLVMDYNDPGTFINGRKALYLKNSKLRSPMGEDLAAFMNEQAILNKELSGVIFDWKALKDHVK